MNFLKNKINTNITYVICTVVMAVIVLAFIISGSFYGNQAVSAMYPGVEFSGQYKIENGDWMVYEKGKHIPSTKGVVTLKGDFTLVSTEDGSRFGSPESGTLLAFYFNHIKCEINEDNNHTHVFDSENDYVGNDDMCGISCIIYEYKGGDEITLTFENPHIFGNETAIDEFLDNLSVYAGTTYENDMMKKGNTQRTIGIALILFAFMILGTAIFSLLIRFKGSKSLWFIGFFVFFAGAYFIFNADGVMYWSEVIKFNTRMLNGSAMLYILSLTAFSAYILINRKTRSLAKFLLTIIGIADALIFILSICSIIKFYDALPYWALMQCIVCIIMSGLLSHSFSSAGKKEFLYAICIIPHISFVLDILATYLGWWSGGYISSIIFIIIFIISFSLLLMVIPRNINAALKAKELETEKKMLKAALTESRISTMISQIQPHFIYNTLGTIEQLCISEPEAASRLVHNFSLYLRGNFSELDNPKPIRFSQEMNHVKHYTDIEQVRFPDMTIQYDLRSVEFVLPALSVQPLVENAIKHGLMGLEEGGIVTISAYETDTHFIVEVKDDGVGFDSDVGYDEKAHVGIKNIRGRIEAMCNGTLTVKSKPGKGTTATIKIPKEVNTDDSNDGR